VVRDGGSCVEPMIDAVRSYATVGEIYGVLRDIHGSYVPSQRLD
jgi:methylmalonyl-CoA mutase N-terminal domain/subunit